MTENPLVTQDAVDGKTPARIVHGNADERGSAHAPVFHGSVRTAAKQPRFAITPSKLQEALLYRWKSALAVGLVFAMLGAGWAWLTYTPKYTATTTMRMTSITPRLIPVARLEDGGRSVEEFQKTETQMIKSRDVLKTVLQKDQIRGLATIRKLENPVTWLEKEIQGTFIVGTDIFRISLSGEDPEDITLIVNTLREVYVNQFINSAKKQQADRFESIVTVMVEAEEKIRKQRMELRTLAENLKTGDTQVLTLKQRMALEEFGERNRELSTLKMEMRRNLALLVVQQAELKALDAVEPNKLPAALLDDFLNKHPSVQKEQLEIARLETQIKEYRKLVTSTNPRLAELELELKSARLQLQKAKADNLPDAARNIQEFLRRQRANLVEQSQEKLRVATEQESVLLPLVAQLKEEANKIGLGSFDVEVRRNEIEQAEGVLKTLRAEKERLEIERFNTKETIVGKQDAEVPTINQASLLKTGSIYALAGLLLGFLSISYLEARLQRVHKAAQVDAELGIQTLGVLPVLAQDDFRVSGQALATNDSIPDIMFTDAVNSLCARLLCDDRLPKSAVIMVTSATEDEGKTMLATELATGLARSGRRTLLVDCDFRNSSCHEQFGLASGPGLSEVLCGESDLMKVLQHVPDSEVRILTTGQSNAQVIKTLNNGKFAGLLARFRQEFDYIIVDSAPTPIVSDGLLIGKLADGVILVVRPKVSKAPAVIAAYEQLTALHIPILGAVVNANPARSAGSYYK